MGTSRRDLRTSGDLVMAPRVPHGLAAAVEGLTREVIRHRPEDIYVFAAQHFEELLKLRDEYGAVTNLPGKSTNTAALREMNQSLKKRGGTEKSVAKTSKERGGWSMNETARVLERHRSIFGDKGKKVSPDEVRALGNEKENKSRRRDELERFANTNNQKRRGSNERFVRRRIPPRDAETPEVKSKSDSNGNPKIISQIPTLTQSTGLLAKDIKSELRKNRNSSRDGRSIRERAERKTSERTERLEIAARQSGATKKTLMRSSHERSLDRLIDLENDDLHGGEIGTDNQKLKTDAVGRSRAFAKVPRTLSMDRVREFVVEKFRGSESWEELRSTNYVDRVQEVIDEASPTILRRVKELSTRSAGRSRGYESVDESTSTSTRSDKSNQTDDIRSQSAMSASRRSRRSTRRSKSKSKSKTSGADSLEGIETLASEAEQLKENRNEIETGKVKKGTVKSTANGLSGESDASDYTDVTRKASASSSISLPAVRPPSSKNHSRSVSRSDSDNLVLPPIPPEAPRSAKHREELILPSLQISKEILRGVEANEEEVVSVEDTADLELHLPDAPTEEIFKDSLNVTPDTAASPRPDSLEPDGSRTHNDQSNDNIAELKSKLNEINSGSDSGRVVVAPDDLGVEGAEGSDGMKERLREIEETEKRIEEILKTEDQGSRAENLDAVSVKEKLIEIQEAEERLRNILDPDANVEENGDSKDEKIQNDLDDLGMKEKLMEIEEAEKRIEKILESEAEEVRKDVSDPGIEEKLIEIEETEKRIEKILQSESQEIQKDEIDDGMKEKLMEIEETEKRIEKILDSENQGTRKDANDLGVKEKLIEIEETEKRIEQILLSEAQGIQKAEVEDEMKEELIEIDEGEKSTEKIFNSEVPQNQNDETNAGFMKDKLMEIEEAEKRLRNVFGSTSGEEDIHNPDIQDTVGENNAAPKTPFIPEIPSEYVAAANQVETNEEEDKHVVVADDNKFPEQPASSEDTQKEFSERNETKAQGNESKIEQFSSGTPDSLGNSYILTEGSPYEIPDSVTTVIIPERQMDTPSSDIIEIVLEDDPGEGSRSFPAGEFEAREDSPEEESREISLKNILDNFGEVVHQETVVGSPSMDVDFIKNLKTANDVVIARKDLGLITEEDDDKDFPETEIVEVVKAPVTPTLHDIPETEEVLELEEARDSSSGKSRESEDRNHESENENVRVEAEGASGIQKIESPEILEPEEGHKKDEIAESGNSFNPEDRNHESVDDRRPSGDRKTRSIENIEPEVTSPTTTAVGSVQQNVTDSATTESTDEVKETTISDDGGNTAAESSVTSPSCGEEIGARNSESSNEVKETTISDQPPDEIGKNLFSLVPQCHGSMPHVPELNLDSLQDITVSSFQLSDDATAEEDSDAGQPQSTSITTATDEARESQEHEPIHEEIIIQETVVVEEDPCTKVTAYVTEPNTENSDPKTAELDSMSIMENMNASEPEEAGLVEPEEVTEGVATNESREITEEVSKKIPEVPEEELKEVHDEITTDIDKKVPQEELEGVQKEAAKDEAKNISEEEPEEAHKDVPEKVTEEVAKEVREEILGEVHEELHEKVSENVAEKVLNDEPEEDNEETAEQVATKVPEEEPEEVHDEATKVVTQTIQEELPAEVHKDESERILEGQAEEIAEKLPEDKPEDLAKESPEEIHEDVTEVAKKVPDAVIEKLVDDTPEQVTGEIHEVSAEDVAEKVPEEKPEDAAKKEPEEKPEDLVSKSVISELETASLQDFKALEVAVGEEYKDHIAGGIEVDKIPESNSPEVSSVPDIDLTVDEIESNSPMLPVLPEVTVSINPAETDDPLTSGTNHDPVSKNLDPPKAEVVTNDLDDNGNYGEKMEYHIYVPDVTASEECSTTESSTFNSAATKIQAGVRGFLTRRRLQSAQRRSSTLDSVPSIQDSFATDVPHLEPIEEVGLAQAATTIQSSYRGYKARQRLHREDAVQKTTMSVENAFSGIGLQHTGEFHDCLPLPPYQDDGKESVGVKPFTSQDDADLEVSAGLGSEEKADPETNGSQENQEWVTESTGTKEESVEDESSLGLLDKKYPYSQHGLNLVVLSGNDAVLQRQYLNFITSIEEVRSETDPLIPGHDPAKFIDGFSTLKSNAGIESLPLDNPDTDISVNSVSAREPLAVLGSPTGLVIEELSKTDEESIPTSSANCVKSGTDVGNHGVSEAVDDSLDLPGLSLETKPENGVTLESGGKECSKMGKPEDVIEEIPASLPADVQQDASLGTMSFSMNVDDMLGLGGESDPPSKMKPILEVTVTPRDLLKLTNRSQGSQASGDRVESPVTMMQIVPKSVEDKSDRSEEGRETEVKRAEGIAKAGTDDGRNRDAENHPVDEAPEDGNGEVDPSNGKEGAKTSSNEDEESSDRLSKTFSIEKE